MTPLLLATLTLTLSLTLTQARLCLPRPPSPCLQGHCATGADTGPSAGGRSERSSAVLDPHDPWDDCLPDGPEPTMLRVVRRATQDDDSALAESAALEPRDAQTPALTPGPEQRLAPSEPGPECGESGTSCAFAVVVDDKEVLLGPRQIEIELPPTPSQVHQVWSNAVGGPGWGDRKAAGVRRGRV